MKLYMNNQHAPSRQVTDCFNEIKSAILSYTGKTDLTCFRQSQKSKGEIVTDIDRALERQIVSVIRRRFPKHGIEGEEGPRIESQDGHVWHIDPVDNTVGLVAGEQEVSSSIALKNGSDHVRSMVINLVNGVVYQADQNKSEKDSHRICTSNASLDDKNRPISTCGYVNPSNIERWRDIMSVFLKNRFPLRISGGAALDLCHVAEGERAGHISLGAHPWDVEAGFHIVQSAGGIVEPLKRFKQRNSIAFIASANREVHERIKQLLGQLIIFTNE